MASTTALARRSLLTTRQLSNLQRMKDMGLTDHETQLVAGYLAGCSEMSAALDNVEEYRKLVAAPAAKSD